MLLARVTQQGGRIATRRARWAQWTRTGSATTLAAEEKDGNSPSDRIHSTDIAFKPNQDGWGATKKYSKNYERIFGKRTKEKATMSAGELKMTFKTRQSGGTLIELKVGVASAPTARHAGICWFSFSLCIPQTLVCRSRGPTW